MHIRTYVFSVLVIVIVQRKIPINNSKHQASVEANGEKAKVSDLFSLLVQRKQNFDHGSFQVGTVGYFPWLFKRLCAVFQCGANVDVAPRILWFGSWRRHVRESTRFAQRRGGIQAIHEPSQRRQYA